jgi:serine/threonine protein kinase
MAAPSSAPRRLGQYSVIRRLAYGGMAEVLLGRLDGADGFSKQVVIKRVHPQHNTNIEFVTMFRDEARITSQLHHGNIVQVIEFGIDGGQHYLVLEYVDGPSLALVLGVLGQQRERMSLAEAAFVTSEIARALDYAHRKKDKNGEPLQVVHRDVSASNILISVEGEVKLADFGIARARARVLPTTQVTGVFKGKLAYTAPEALRTGRVDARSDLFALGVVAYEMLTGIRPFAADTEAATIGRLLAGIVAPPSELGSEIPEELDEIVLSMLRADPDQRPGRGLEIAEALAPYQVSESGSPNELLARTVARVLEAPQAVPTSPPGAGARPSVLVVDQSRTMRALLKSKLSGRFDVLEAASAAEAVSVVHEQVPSAIVCERSLPDGSGVELCADLRAAPKLKNVPFVLIAADITETLRTEAVGAGAQAVMKKAPDALELEHTLAGLVEQSSDGAKGRST